MCPNRIRIQEFGVSSVRPVGRHARWSVSFTSSWPVRPVPRFSYSISSSPLSPFERISCVSLPPHNNAQICFINRTVSFRDWMRRTRPGGCIGPGRSPWPLVSMLLHPCTQWLWACLLERTDRDFVVRWVNCWANFSLFWLQNCFYGTVHVKHQLFPCSSLLDAILFQKKKSLSDFLINRIGSIATFCDGEVTDCCLSRGHKSRRRGSTFC
jgi:hypothetical protein